MGGQRQRRRQVEAGSFGRKIAREWEKPKLDILQNIVNDFLTLNSPNDLCILLGLNVVEILDIYNAKYETFSIIKKGKARIINKPHHILMSVQRKLLVYLNAVYKIYFSNTISAYAFITSVQRDIKPIIFDQYRKEKNIIGNASPHTNKIIVANLDIEAFFPSITEAMIENLFRSYPFHFSDELVYFLCKIVTFNGKLPIGAPTSPILSNFILTELDKQFSNIKEITYTRYADDFTFSSNYYNEYEFKKIIENLTFSIEQEGFRVNKQKIKILKNTDRQEVTGIIVNEKLNVQRTYIREIRAILHSIAIKGWEDAAKLYVEKNKINYLKALRKYFYTEQEYNVSDDVLLNYCEYSSMTWYFYKSLTGKIEHIGYVKGKSDSIYNKLKAQFYLLKKQGNLSRFDLKPEIKKSPDIVYVTNATANSIVFYAYVFLKNSGYSDLQISHLRKLYSVDGKIKYDRIITHFQNQSAYFLNLYAYMTDFDRFENFANNLKQDKFKQIFKYNNDVFSLITQFNRKIYHSNFYCSNIRNDYSENSIHNENTGVFYEKEIDDKPKYYILIKSFLDTLGMRVCKICGC